MSTRVYRFGCLAPTKDTLPLVRAQLRAAHDYQNDLIAIERGRRYAIRTLYDADPLVQEALEVLKAATKTDRKARLRALREARREVLTRETDELARVNTLAQDIARDARALTSTFWGSYLDIEARARQSRAAPLYGDDAVTPSDPRFRAWRGEGLSEGQLGMQLQGGLKTSDGLGGADTRVRVILTPDRLNREGYPRYGVLWLRVGSDGRDPIWAQWPIKLHRAIPDAAVWKWVRVSTRLEGVREEWSCEVTLDDPYPPARVLDRSLKGAIAVEWDWTTLDEDRVRVASWADTYGMKGEVILPTRLVRGLRKPEGIRAVRDLLANDLRPALAERILTSKDRVPEWLRRVGGALEFRKSLAWLHEVARRWRSEKCDAARDAYEVLQAWELRDAHLLEYESGARREALRERRELYRVLAAQWSRGYRTILLSDQDLSREAVFGAEGSARQLSACYELRGALRNAFGDDAVDSRWRDAPGENEERSWCERARDAWIVGGARDGVMFAKVKEKTGNAWTRRKAKKTEKGRDDGSAREALGKEAG